MLPTIKPDTTTRATQAQVLQALAALGSLPSREADSDGLDKAAYSVALDGVSRYALAEAVRAVLQNKLGHAFFPSPPELRRLCDEAHRPVLEMEHRARITEEMRSTRRQYERTRRTLTPEAKARSAEIYRRFREQCDDKKQPEIFPALDPELVAQVPDAPKRGPSNFEKAQASIVRAG